MILLLHQGIGWLDRVLNRLSHSESFDGNVNTTRDDKTALAARYSLTKSLRVLSVRARFLGTLEKV